LPLTITSDEFKKPTTNDDVIPSPSKFGEILLELKVTNFAEGQKEISFELEIFAEDDPFAKTDVPSSSTTELVPILWEYSCDCDSLIKLLRMERNPDVSVIELNNDVAVQKCKSGEEKTLIDKMFCAVSYRLDVRRTIVFKVSRRFLESRFSSINILNARKKLFLPDKLFFLPDKLFCPRKSGNIFCL
jgi:hypothetical protein